MSYCTTETYTMKRDVLKFSEKISKVLTEKVNAT